MAIDVGITQGSYWGGGQIPYWLYMVFVILPFTGLLGLDHLLLRSPQTFILKLLTMIPLFGFWYFYDIGQAFGERELVEKYGLGVPYYGPIGLGAGMFVNKDNTNLAPVDVQKPWLFMVYVIVSILFLAFPINSLIIGDYEWAIARILMYFPLGLLSIGFTVLLSIGWGGYDIYRVIFDTRGVFEKGLAHIGNIPPFIDEYSDKCLLGKGKCPERKPFSVIDILLAPLNLITGGLAGRIFWGVFGRFERRLENKGKELEQKLKSSLDVSSKLDKMANSIESKIESKIQSGGTSQTDNRINVAIKKLDKVTDDAIGVVIDTPGTVIGSATTAASLPTTSIGAATAVAKLQPLSSKMISAGVNTLDAVADRISNPEIQTRIADGLIYGITGVKLSNQSGGAIIPSASYSPSSAVLLFCVAVVAFGGYALYTMKKTLGPGIDVESDDSPPNPATVRKASKTS